MLEKREKLIWRQLLVWCGAIAAIAAIIYYISSLKLSANGEMPALSSASIILIDAQSGEVLFEKNANDPLPPASMSKMMTELIVLDHIDQGAIAWNEQVEASAYAAGVPGSQIGFEEGERYTVRDLFDAMAVHSANDAAVALAEHISGSEAAFVDLMNIRASKIGLSKGTAFANATGLSRQDLREFPTAASEGDTLMTAKDSAQLAGYLMKKYPEVLEVTSRSSVQMPNSARKLAATNLMLAGKDFAYPGNDGFKTGYTPEAGYCFTGTAMQDGRRLISVVMGSSSPELRFIETRKLYEYGFKKEGFNSLFARI